MSHMRIWMSAGILLTLGLIMVLTRKETVPTPLWTLPGDSAPASRTSWACGILEQELPHYLTDSYEKKYASATLGKLPAFRDSFALTSHNGEGCVIDILLQRHYGERGSEAVRKSQVRVLNLIDVLRPDVIAWEGSDLDSLTYDRVVTDVVDRAASEHVPTPPESLRVEITARIPYDGMLQYIMQPVRQTVIGAEDYDVHSFHSFVLYIHDHVPGIQPPIVALADPLESLRNEIALSRLSAKLHRTGGHHGVLVVGFSHQVDLYRLGKQYGLHMRCFDLH